MTKRKAKKCLGCLDPFITYRNYDYCVDCAVNGNRYYQQSNCPECDGSGMIKFSHQQPRPCKLCFLTKTPMNNQRQTKEEKFWEEIDQLAQEKIYQLLTNNIPLPNLKLITESWRYEDKQQKLTGLFLHKDADYRTLLSEMEAQYSEDENLDPEYLAEEIALWYCRLVIKSLISDLSDYSCYDPSYFENLTTSEH